MTSKEFVCCWRIENYSFSYLFDFKSPTFMVQNLDCEGRLHLFVKHNTEGLFWKIERKYLACQLSLNKCNDTSLSRKIILNFWYELTDIDGGIVKTSKRFSHIFSKEMFSEPCELMDLEDLMKKMSLCPDETLVLRCYLLSSPDSCSALPIYSCEIDTTAHLQVVPFEWHFEFPSDGNWSVVKNVLLTNMALEIIFKFVSDEIEIEFSSNIKDNREHFFVCEIAICNFSGAKIASKEHSEMLCENNKTWRFPNFVSREQLEIAECFNRQEIRFKIQLTYPYSSTINYSENSKKNVEFNENFTEGKCVEMFVNEKINAVSDVNHSSAFQQGVHKMLLEKQYSNIKLRVDDGIYPAHRLILAAQSPVFSNIFKQDMASSILDIPDVDKNTFKSFLEYIYTCEIRDMNEEMALNLLKLAFEYQVLPLSEKCSTFLKSILSVNNVCKILSIADEGNHENLKLFAVDYIVENSKELLSSQEWLQLIKANDKLVSHILFKVSNKFAVDGKEEAKPGTSKNNRDLQVDLSPVNLQKSDDEAGSSKNGTKENNAPSSMIAEPEGRQIKKA